MTAQTEPLYFKLENCTSPRESLIGYKGSSDTHCWLVCNSMALLGRIWGLAVCAQLQRIELRAVSLQGGGSHLESWCVSGQCTSWDT